MEKQIFESISKRAEILLKRPEGYDVEFKESLSALDHADIVAFANSTTGGTIFIGVKEEKGYGGIQKSTIIGCSIGDKEKRVIVDKANNSCIPPVKVEIYIENSKEIPFFRVEIPAGDEKPYCTSGGLYKIRDDGRSSNLTPSRLLLMFEERESLRFIQRFKDATKELENSLLDIKNTISNEMFVLFGNIEKLKKAITENLDEVYNHAQEAATNSDDAKWEIDSISGSVDNIGKRVSNIEKRLGSIMNQLNLFDPILAENKELIIDYTKDIIIRNRSISREELVNQIAERFEYKRNFIASCIDSLLLP